MALTSAERRQLRVELPSPTVSRVHEGGWESCMARISWWTTVSCPGRLAQRRRFSRHHERPPKMCPQAGAVPSIGRCCTLDTVRASRRGRRSPSWSLIDSSMIFFVKKLTTVEVVSRQVKLHLRGIKSRRLDSHRTVLGRDGRLGCSGAQIFSREIPRSETWSEQAGVPRELELLV